MNTQTTLASNGLPWWKEAIVYQIYPSSFKDSNGDGMGDIAGITSKLDYLKSLGVDVIWVCPFYDSPQHDMGYDISDYQAVYPPYGTVADVEECIQECHKRGIRFVQDLVINHSSSEHRYFKESRSSKTNPKRDWYIWRPAKYVDGKRCPPNNWKAHFGGSVWEWDELTEEYYLHYFCVEQPDFNWENPEVREALYNEAIRFWLDKGCDGFRIDTVNMYSKHLDFPDAEVQHEGEEFVLAKDYYSNGPRLHEYLREMNEQVFSKYDCFTVGECPAVESVEQIISFVGASQRKLDTVFEFALCSIDASEPPFHKMPKSWKLSELKKIVARSQSFIDGTDGWITNFLENHDQARAVTRYGSDAPEFRTVSAKMLAVFQMALSGTNFIHQGGEIGMYNAPRSWPIEEYKDVDSINFYAEEKASSRFQRDPKHMDRVLDALRHTSRDHGRLPMQWDDSPNAGFTTGKPWMRVHDDYETLNAKQQEADPSSVLSFYKAILKLRKQFKSLALGTYKEYEADDENVMVFSKTYDGERTLIVLNWTKEKQNFTFPEGFDKRQLIISNVEGEQDALQPYEARIYVC
ncbi:maltase malt [Protomyces lactucae-debilis]|uniref:Maltase malt n=1 Tax=Protomyces lactucae-debilis TaxID=2754530 RepID=A0A1Y2FV76_PROLT|nr:maltase malt [Protomyces lactucae-debilis]ORY87911.1 maltase malt [Protomyces lactucae-debilis]